MDKNLLGSKLITDKLLRNWIRCKRKAWLEIHGDSNKRLWSAHRTLQLDHQYRSFLIFKPNTAKRGIDACREGSNTVLGLRLKGLNISGGSLQAHPPLLQKVPGQSCWGKFAYRPVLARQGKRLTKEHRLALSFYGFLLEQLQQTPVAEGLAVCQSKNMLEMDTVHLKKSLQRQLFESLNKLEQDLKLEGPPPITTDRRKCSLCSWKDFCDSEAKKKGYLSEVSGVGSRRVQILEEIGIENLEALAKMNPNQLKIKLKDFGDQHSDIAMQIISQAKAQHENIITRLDNNPALPELKYAPGVLLYDIESDPDERDDFLHGFVKLAHKSNGDWNINESKYHPMLMLSKHGEAFAWKRLKQKLNKYKDWPILHYGETEALSLFRIAERQGANEEELIYIKNNLIDIHSRIKKHWLLPLNSYGLKSVAGWLGFRWHQKNADGSKALLWWRKWNAHEGKIIAQSNTLKLIFKYNHDDCLATWKIASWILKQN